MSRIKSRNEQPRLDLWGIRNRSQWSAEGAEFLALAYPRSLLLEKCRVEVALGINWRLAIEGAAHPTGELVLGLGTEAEVMAIIARARSLPVGGLHGVEFAPPPIDRVTVSPLPEIFARGRDLIAQGREDTERRLLVAVGNLAECMREATRLRRVRAGRRSLEGRAP